MKRLLAASVAVLALAACNDQYGSSGRSLAPIPARTMALMAEKGMSKTDPILVRVYKKESELEVWKQAPGGEYALLKTFPVCRWSGQLGPKVKEGDRQAPEGFYTISPAQMNPNSSFYLSFDTGYPNAYDRQHGRTGSYLMVHGTCSSRGCYAMTDEGIAEVYALARESFSAGQRGFQFQAYPFRLTAENMAKYRNDPHMPFWRNLKEGADHFEVTKREPVVAVCGGRYAFNTVGTTCRPEPGTAQLVAERQAEDQVKVAELVAKGTPSVRLLYADGGGHESFRGSVAGAVDPGSTSTFFAARRNVGDVSRPDALAAGPREVAMDEPAARAAPAGRSKGSAVLAGIATGRDEARVAAPAVPRGAPGGGRTVLASADPDEAAGLAPVPPAPAEKPFYQRMFGSVLGGGQAGEAAAAGGDAASGPPAAAPLPPRRVVSGPAKPAGGAAPAGVKPKPADAPKPQAALDPARRADLAALPGGVNRN